MGSRMVKKDQQQQRDLYESERNFRLLVEGVVDYALYMLDPDGVVTSWNIGGQRIKGYAPDEIIGQHFSRFYTEADRANGKPLRALRIAREQGRYEEEGWRVRKDGTFFWASVIIDPIYEDGNLVGFAKITRDITERREAQLKLEQMHQQLAESQKLDALGQLTGGVAHDFNNLLMIISGSLHTLRKAVGDDPKSQRALSAIEGATKRGASLTSQLLTFARRQSVNPQAVDVAERIDAVREVLDTAVGSAVTLQFDVGPGVWPVMVDVAEFETALVNLVINARDAMAGGGSSRYRRVTMRPATRLTLAAMSRSRCRTPAPASRLISSARSSIPSSPPSRSARAPVSDCLRFMASRIRPAERSRWRANSARAPGSRSCCRARKPRPRPRKSR